MRDIALGLVIGLLFFAGGVVMTALAIRHATSSTLWDWILWGGYAVMAMSAGTLALLVWDQLHNVNFYVPAAVLLNIGIGAVMGAIAWGVESGTTREYNTPWVYAVPQMKDNKLDVIYAMIGARGTARQHNINFYFTALTKDKPMKGAGGFFVPMLDPGSISTNFELDIGDYFITMRPDSGMFRESLSIESDGANGIKQKIKILDENNTVVLDMSLP